MPEISDFSQVIGELRNFAATQLATNAHMLEELKKISERMSGFGEVSAGLVEYRKTLHERFGRIHEQMALVDERCDKLETKTDHLEDQVAQWKGQFRTLAWAIGVAGTAISALISAYGGVFLRTLLTHN